MLPESGSGFEKRPMLRIAQIVDQLILFRRCGFNPFLLEENEEYHLPVNFSIIEGRGSVPTDSVEF
jgi:hypothetical protein